MFWRTQKIKARTETAKIVERTEFEISPNLSIIVPDDIILDDAKSYRLRFRISDNYRNSFYVYTSKEGLQKFTDAIVAINDFYQAL